MKSEFQVMHEYICKCTNQNLMTSFQKRINTVNDLQISPIIISIITDLGFCVEDAIQVTVTFWAPLLNASTLFPFAVMDVGLVILLLVSFTPRHTNA